MDFRIQWALLCCTWSHCGGEMPNIMPLEARLWTGTPSFLMHSVDQNKSQVLSKFNRWGNRFHASMGELGRRLTKHPQAFFCCKLHSHCTAESITVFSLQCCEKPWHIHYYSLIHLHVYTLLWLEYDMPPTGSCLNTYFPALSTILKIAVPAWWRCVLGNGPLMVIEQLCFWSCLGMSTGFPWDVPSHRFNHASHSDGLYSLNYGQNNVFLE